MASRAILIQSTIYAIISLATLCKLLKSPIQFVMRLTKKLENFFGEEMELQEMCTLYPGIKVQTANYKVALGSNP